MRRGSGCPFLKEYITEVVGQIHLDLLAIVAFKYRRVLVQRVTWEMIQLSEWVLTLNDPLLLEIGLEIKCLSSLVVHQALVDEGGSKFWLVLWVCPTLHPRNTLEVRTFINTEDQNDVVTS
jgi:hypothetical protein